MTDWALYYTNYWINGQSEKWQIQVILKDRDNMVNLALANILDVVPFIDNIGDNADGPLNRALLRIYERNLAALQGDAINIDPLDVE